MKILERKYIKGNMIALIIMLTPLLIYIHLLFTGSSDYFYFLGFKINNWMGNNEIFIWMLLNDLVPLILLSIFFFTTLSKWRYFLLVLTTAYFLSILYTLDVFRTFIESVFSLKALVFVLLFVGIQLFIDLNVSKFLGNRYSDFGLLEAYKSIRKLRYKDLQCKIRAMHGSKSEISLNTYLRNAYYLRFYIEEQLNKNRGSNFDQIKYRSKNSSNIFIICTLVLLIIIWIAPYLIPQNVVTTEVLGIHIHSYGFTDIMTLMWFASRKLIVVLFLSIWFIDSPYWWRYAILSPLFLFSYQFWETFQETTILDSFSNLRVLPLVLLNIFLVMLISKLVKYNTSMQILYKDISKEIDEILEQLKREYPAEVAKTITEIKSNKKTHSEASYRKQLKSLERELSARLDLNEG